ncbi:MAG: ABC transporter permease subunit [Chloroflexi bacterium]|nr:ABC transporter permease subunit [Chloroflexota bacterium]MDA1228882.1 ABC transporter permease subunit [Chloroflexota bacterium]
MGSRQAIRGLLESRRLLTYLLVIAATWSILSVDWTGQLVHPGGAASAAQIFSALFTPRLSPDFLLLALSASWTTLTFAVAGITLAIAIGLPMGVLGSGVLLAPGARRLTTMAVVRVVLGFLRSIHELVWAWLFVVAIGLSPIAGIFALAIPYAGILGRIYAEILVDVPEQPLNALRSSGASEFKIFLYGRLPMALPDMLSYTFYRFECGIRSAAILSFVGITGLGYQIKLSLDDLLYNEVWTLLFFLVALVVLVDLWSSVVRRSVTQ